jgi:hypothetical protein
MNTYWQEREKEKRERRRWMGNALIEADCYADALRMADLLEDGLEIDEAEQDSRAILVALI